MCGENAMARLYFRKGKLGVERALYRRSSQSSSKVGKGRQIDERLSHCYKKVEALKATHFLYTGWYVCVWPS